MFNQPQTTSENYLINHHQAAADIIVQKLKTAFPQFQINNIRFDTYYSPRGEPMPNCLIIPFTDPNRGQCTFYYAAANYPTKEQFLHSFNTDFAFLWLSRSNSHGYTWPMPNTSFSKNTLEYYSQSPYYERTPLILKVTDYFDPATGVIRLQELFKELNKNGLIHSSYDAPIRGVTRGAVFAPSDSMQGTEVIQETIAFPGAITAQDFEQPPSHSPAP